MPGWISEDIWTKLTEYWTSVEFKKKSELAKAARLSDKDGSLHTGGSISMGAHRRRLEKSLKRPATQDEVFEYTHMKKLKNGTKTTWIDPRADTTYEFIQSQPTDDQGKPIQPSRRILWTCGLRRLVAYIRKEFTALDQSLVLVVGLLDLVVLLPQGPQLIRMSLSY